MTTLAPKEASPAAGEDGALTAATKTLLNCYLRETGGNTQPADGELRQPVWGGAASVVVGVRYWGATLRDRYDRAPLLLAGDGEPIPLDLIAESGAEEAAA